MNIKNNLKCKKDWERLPQASILMPTHNNNQITVECLESIEKLDYPKDKIEIIISDGVTNDGTLGLVKSKIKEMTKRGFLKVVLLENEMDPGPIACMNQCYNQADKNSKYILKLDNDVVLAPDSLIKSVRGIERDKKIGAIGGTIYHYDRPDIIAQCAIFLSLYTGRNHSISPSVAVDCDYVTGCYMFIRRKIIDYPFLDEKFFNYYDEVDFCLKIKKKGYKVVYNPEIKLWHRISATTQKMPTTATYYRVRNKFLWRHKHANIFQMIIFTIFTICAMLPVFTFKSIFLRNKGINIKEIKIFLKAIKDGLMNKGGPSIEHA